MTLRNRTKIRATFLAAAILSSATRALPRELVGELDEGDTSDTRSNTFTVLLVEHNNSMVEGCTFADAFAAMVARFTPKERSEHAPTVSYERGPKLIQAVAARTNAPKPLIRRGNHIHQ